MKTKLEVGDKIYAISYGSVNSIHTIERVTPTMAIAANDLRFRLEFSSNGILNKIGRSLYSNTYYRIETPELKQQLKEQRILAKIKYFNYETLSKKLQEQVYNILITAEINQNK